MNNEISIQEENVEKGWGRLGKCATVCVPVCLIEPTAVGDVAAAALGAIDPD